MGFTFICCYNNVNQLEDFLLPSLSALRDNHIEYNTILIDTVKNSYQSAAQAYNSEVSRNKNILKDILVFLHQDMAFTNTELFLEMSKEFTNNQNQILGVAGMPAAGRTISNLKYRANGQFITSTRVPEKAEVLSVDECLFAIHKDLFNKLCFDDKTCDSWHLYAVDLCYQANLQYKTISYVLPQSIFHKDNSSNGLFTDNKFLKTLWRVARKYRAHYSYIYTPCYIVNTDCIPCFFKISRTFLKNLITRK